MNAILSLENLASWFVQVSVIAFVGAALPMLLRIRHPKTQLAYYHLVMLLCFALPLIQPWQTTLLFASGAAPTSAPPAASWASILIGLVLLGILVRVCWLGVGLWQLRRYRRSAIPLYPVPQSVRDAGKLAGADALFCLSADVTGPATLGYIDPVVLLPVSFVSLDEDAQRSIACHELLHVRRSDWLVTIAEEIVGALFWFNPAIRWLLAQAKLTREQLIDAEVVRMTAPAAYVQALLSMAIATTGRWAVPAAPFFTEGHLASRMRALLTNPKRSRLRLLGSYAAAATVLLAAGLAMTLWVPLMGEPQVVSSAPPVPPMFFTVFIPPPQTVQLELSKQPRFNVFVRRPENAAPSVSFSSALPEGVMPPPPPPPPPPQFGFLGASGIRVFRPGDKPSEEELDRFLKGFPERSVVQVERLDDGTIRRIMVQSRRVADAANTMPFGDPTVLGYHVTTGTTAAESAVPADGVH